jgi:hypothetical protein
LTVALSDVVAASAVFPDTYVDTSRYGGPGRLPLRVVMVAIAGAESHYDGNAEGDDVSIFRRLGADAYNNAIAHSCAGKTAFGAWQISLQTWWSLVQRVSGTSDPCVQAAWLKVYRNNAIIAATVARPDGSGLTNWTTYTGKQWVAYLGEAQRALEAAGVEGARAVPQVQAPAVTPNGVVVVPMAMPATASAGGLFGTGIEPQDIVVLAIVAKLIAAGLASL